MAWERCKAPDCVEPREAVGQGEFALWCGLHGDLLLDYRLQVLEDSDGHFHAEERRHCPACRGWASD